MNGVGGGVLLQNPMDGVGMWGTITEPHGWSRNVGYYYRTPWMEWTQEECGTISEPSAGLRSVEAPGQQCYRKSRRRHEHINVMIVRTCTALCFNSKCQGM